MKEKVIQKKRLIIIAAIVVVLLAAGVVLFILLAPKTIEGDWELIDNPEITRATPDEVKNADKVYYSFSKPGEYGDGTYKTYFDGGVEEGKYKLSETDGNKTINMGTEDLVYTITGSKVFGTAKLKITYPAQTDEQTGQTTPAQDYVFTQAKAPDYEKGSYSSYQTDDLLLGEWITKERTLAYYIYNLTYTETVGFSDDGIMTIHYESEDLMLDRVLYFAYSTEDNTLTFSSVTDKETRYAVGYETDQDGNLKFSDTTSESMFSDAFFSDVTYYKSENLPQDSADETSMAE